MAKGYIPYAYLVNEYLRTREISILETGSRLWCKRREQRYVSAVFFTEDAGRVIGGEDTE
jgi:hypothetical protein